ICCVSLSFRCRLVLSEEDLAMNAVRVIFVAAVLLMLGVQSSEGCWRAIEPSAFASTCPILVSGTIARIDAYCGEQERGHDVAYIAIHQILKNDLKDEPLRVGGHLKAKMSSSKNRVRVSTDIRYELGTGGLWEDVGVGPHNTCRTVINSASFPAAPLAASAFRAAYRSRQS